MSTLNYSSHRTLGQSQYGKLAMALRERIVQGEWAPGDSIPSESLLAQNYGVALGTIRQALALLVEDGVLQRRHGKGTFVSQGVSGTPVMRFFRFSGFDENSEPPSSLILSARLRSSTATEISSFGQSTHHSAPQVLQLERLRSFGQVPRLLETIVLPLPLFGALAELDIALWDAQLYPMYHARCGVLIQHAQDNLSFSQLNGTQAKRLQLPSGHPCVLVERQAFDLAGRCVELRTTRGDAHSFRYTAQVR
jgi:GntR family transcriptional regulator